MKEVDEMSDKQQKVVANIEKLRATFLTMLESES